MAARRRVGREQADEHHCRAGEGVDGQLHGGVFAARRAPDGDEEVLGYDGDFVKDEKQEEIEAEKDSVDSADQCEEEGEELVGAQLDIPTEEDTGDRGQAGEQNEYAADAVGCEQEVNAHRRNPGQVDEGYSSLPHAADETRDGNSQPGHGYGQRQPARERGTTLGQQRFGERSGKREIDCEGQHQNLQ